MNNFTFDAEKHEYRDGNGRLGMSNTDVLSASGLCDYSMVPYETRILALALGSAVHLATALLDRNRSWRTYSYQFPVTMIAPYVEAWKKCKREMKFHPELIEEPLHDPIYDYYTTPDSFGASKYGWTTIQKKTGPVEDWVGLQLAAEERAVAASGRYATKDWSSRMAAGLKSSSNRFGVELRDDGTYKITRFDDPGFEQDIRIFIGFLVGCQWKKAHGYK